MFFINDKISHQYFQGHHCTFIKGFAYPKKTSTDVPFNTLFLHRIEDISI